MITAALIFALIALLGSFLGGALLPDMSWRGVAAGAAGATVVFGLLTGAILLVLTVVSPPTLAEDAPMSDAVSSASLISSFAGE